jgi:chemotaxis protein MotA
MDLTTLIGVMLGLVLILGSILAGGSLGSFVHIPSMCVTIGGSIAGLLISFPLQKVKATFAVASKTLKEAKVDLVPWYHKVLEMATVARRDGVLALEDHMESIDEEFLKRGLQMTVDGNAPEAVEAILEKEIENLEDRHAIGHQIFKSLGTFAPAFGMIGTLMGLVQMLKSLDDPSSIGEGMAVALLTTFYGALFANLICIPVQGKLEQRTEEEVKMKKMLLAGILGIQAGDSPRVIGDKLLVYLTPADRKKVQEEGS